MSTNVDADPLRHAGVMYTPSAHPDFDALRSCWHPVALSEDLTEVPFAGRLLDERIVIWRDAMGTPTPLPICASIAARRFQSARLSVTKFNVRITAGGFGPTAPAR